MTCWILAACALGGGMLLAGLIARRRRSRRGDLGVMSGQWREGFHYRSGKEDQ